MRSTYAIAGWVLRRMLGVVYLAAFWSVAQQIAGLIGPDGISPVGGWLAGRDAWLQAVPAAGAVLAALLAAGVAPALLLPPLWALYLVVTVLMGEFLSYQWDSLLLETGLLAIALAPFRWRDRLDEAADPPPLARLLLWWLLFRLMFGSGVVKLTSGDPTWRGLTAMAVHYETQPVPTPLAWYAAQLPQQWHAAATAAVLAIELGVPWLVLLGTRLRRCAAIVLIGLQLLIALTGNYAFFNLLTIALCVLWLDDRLLSRVARRRSAIALPSSWKQHVLPTALAIVTLPVSAAIVASQLGFGMPRLVVPLAVAVDPLRSVNPYGLFAVMTTERNEIVIEGSADGSTWIEYEFRHKPGAVTRRPTLVAPFQPRLDWQMWFAALSVDDAEPWFQRFMRRLHENSPAVVALLETNPFPESPPRFIRARMYRYRFTRNGESPDAWWSRQVVGEYARYPE